jgi:hypothetical protein
MHELQRHKWMTVAISDIFQPLNKVTPQFIYEHLCYFTPSVNTVVLNDLHQASRYWPTATWQRYSCFDTIARANCATSRRAYIRSNHNIQLLGTVSLSELVLEQEPWYMTDGVNNITSLPILSSLSYSCKTGIQAIATLQLLCYSQSI